MKSPELPRIESDRETIRIQRQVRFVRDDVVGMSEEIIVDHEHRAAMGTGPYWFFAAVHRHRGEIGFVQTSGTSQVESERFCWLFPCFSVVELRFTRFHCTSTGVFGRTPLPADLGDEPRLFELAADPCPESPAEVAAFVRAHAGASRVVRRAEDPSALASAAKRAIDRAFAVEQPLARIAAELGVAPSQLSRAFKTDYGLPPRVYRHRLRVLQAIMGLLRGGDIAQVGFEAGFGDLSRFYKQFRAITRVSPGTYAVKES